MVLQNTRFKRHFSHLALAVMLSGMAFSTLAADTVLRKPVGFGEYEIVYNPNNNAVYAATTKQRSEPGGAVYQLNASTLDTTHIIDTPNKAFGAALNGKTNTLYFGDTFTSALMAVDASSGKVAGTLALVPQAAAQDKKPGEEKNRPPAPRELAVNEATNTIYVGGIGRADSVIWVVDGKNLTLKHTITHLGKLNTGLALDSQTNRLYTTNADGELIIIDTTNNKVLERHKIVDDGKDHMLLNISLDTQGQRAFISDGKEPGLFVVDLKTNKVVNHIATPTSVAVLFNAKRDEIYATHRTDGSVSIIDGKTLAVTKTIKLPVHPNSLAVSPDGNTLYVTVKQEASRTKPATAPDDIVRIALN
ncbi:YncE family protein [Mangrovibacter plantisponsor]|uniref:YVTN family beta-propeller protein n=1 Tax=Mangrovibacter plantisponsor TaxID=451513 RepID=A0A317QAG2_9ENTR|nr:YncE family protein [Mangrovibacter plantisponsor]PWW12765.1 YVTN family beta-propeller protein [Mangrovibacter plantisponsor]